MNSGSALDISGKWPSQHLIACRRCPGGSKIRQAGQASLIPVVHVSTGFDTSLTARWGYRPMPVRDFAFGTGPLCAPPPGAIVNLKALGWGPNPAHREELAWLEDYLQFALLLDECGRKIEAASAPIRIDFAHSMYRFPWVV